jgi:hypothetical protein
MPEAFQLALNGLLNAPAGVFTSKLAWSLPNTALMRSVGSCMSTYKRYVVEPAVTAGDASTVRVYWAWANPLISSALQQQSATETRERKQFMLDILTV